jgi:hypothetical protein
MQGARITAPDGIVEASRLRAARIARSYPLLLAALAAAIGVVAVEKSAIAQYSRSPGYRPPPCEVVTKNPLRGAMGGAAGGAIIGAIAGNAGIGAAAGAGVVGIARAVRRGSARNSGACY